MMVCLCLTAQRRADAARRRPSDLHASGSLHPFREEAELQLDCTAASAALSPEQTEHYMEIFTKFSQGSGQLSRHGLQRAMRAAGIAASSVAEQGQYRKVQTQVLEHCRGKDCQDEEANPLMNEKGGWALEEFLLMIAGMQQVERRERAKANKAVADELGLSTGTLEELKAVFDEVDVADVGRIRVQHMQRLLAMADLHPMEKALKLLLRQNSLKDELTFAEFLEVMVKVEELIHPAQDLPSRSLPE